MSPRVCPGVGVERVEEVTSLQVGQGGVKVVQVGGRGGGEVVLLTLEGGGLVEVLVRPNQV